MSEHVAIPSTHKTKSINAGKEKSAATVGMLPMPIIIPAFIQRKCTDCEERKMQSKPLISFIQKKAALKKGIENDSAHDLIQNSRGNGIPMQGETKNFMESRFNNDFTNIRIHTGEYASVISNQLGANALTVGNDIYFNKGRYNPGSSEGKHLLAHELTHTIQQNGATGTTNIIQRDPDKKLEAIKLKLKNNQPLTQEEQDYVDQIISQEVISQLGIIHIDTSQEVKDIDKHFKARLELRLSGAAGALAKSLEGIASTDIDISGKLKDKKVTITIGPPAEENRMAAMIREKLFPNGSILSFTVPFSEAYFKYFNWVTLMTGITFSITGKGAKNSDASIQINTDAVPSDAELIVTLIPLFAGAGAHKPKELPNDHWILTPRPRVFATMGYGRKDDHSSFAGTLGADLPLGYDTKNPFIYVGAGARASFDTNTGTRLGGSMIIGYNFDPLSLQAGLGGGVSIGKDKAVPYFDVEGSAGYKISPHVGLMLLLSIHGDKDGPLQTSGQVGASYNF